MFGLEEGSMRKRWWTGNTCEVGDYSTFLEGEGKPILE